MVKVWPCVTLMLHGLSRWKASFRDTSCPWSADPLGPALPPPGRVSSDTPHVPKLPLIRPKSLMSTKQSPLYSALGLYPTSPHASPKLGLSREKSEMSTQLSLLMSPAL